MIKTGIYSFVNKQNGKRYIGQSINIFDRQAQHKYRYYNLSDSGYNMPIHLAFRKYGWDSFDFEIIEECSILELDEKERYYIEKYNTISPNGYNLLIGGQQNRVDIIKHTCPICGKTKSSPAEMCLNCRKDKRQDDALLLLEEIDINFIKEILDTSFEAVAKKYGYVCGNSIVKKLKALNIPHKKNDLFKYYEQYTGVPHPIIIAKENAEKLRLQNKFKSLPSPVDQYDLSNNFIQTYPSAYEAARQCNLRSGHISENISGKRKRVGGFIWKRHINN